MLFLDVKLPSCKHIYDSGLQTSGLYKLNLNDGMGEFTVFCDMSLQGGGWTVFQRRVDNTTSFNKNRAEYEVGFGNFNGNFWLGLEYIRRMTNYNGLTFEMHIGLQSYDTILSEYGYLRYPSFRLGSSSQNYQIIISDFDDTLSTALEALHTPHNGSYFSTPDNDLDGHSSHCALDLSSGWWFDDINCGKSNLNGVYYNQRDHPTSTHDGIIWEGFEGSDKTLRTAVMAVRPVL